jgi:uncharacterized delta-60 repeat protein
MRRLPTIFASAALLVSAFIGIFAITPARSDSATMAKHDPAAVLDPSFGKGGLLALRHEKLEAESPIAATATNGDIVLGGRSDLRFLTAAGKPASIYGVRGTLTLPQPEDGEFRLSAIAIDPHGRLLVVGTSSYEPATKFRDATEWEHELEPSAIRVLRYLPDGTLDPTFGTGGIVETALGLGPPRLKTGQPIGPEASVEASGVAIDPRGGLVITGSAVIGLGPSCVHDIFNEEFVSSGFVARMTEGGSLNQSFGEGGVVGGRNLDETPLHAESVGEPVLSPDGSITYRSTGVDPCEPRYGLAQLTAEGRIRKSFGTGGSIRGYFTSVAAGTDGSIVAVAGEGWSGNEPYEARVIKVGPSGRRDHTFGHHGQTLVRLGRGLANELGSVAVDADGRILLAGSLGNGKGRWMVLVRLSPNGMREPGFGSDGRVSTPYPSLVNISSVAESDTASMFDSKGRLVTIHRYSTPRGSARVLARYLLPDRGRLDRAIGRFGRSAEPQS